MSSKPVVAMALSRAVYDVMFTPDDLTRLREAAVADGTSLASSRVFLRRTS
ncbi:MAG: hypothetical protein M3478_08135 [Planctomycetota bacterium]|nr:hypothetical protein [Planctomycetota bacterium]